MLLSRLIDRAAKAARQHGAERRHIFRQRIDLPLARTGMIDFGGGAILPIPPVERDLALLDDPRDQRSGQRGRWVHLDDEPQPLHRRASRWFEPSDRRHDAEPIIGRGWAVFDRNPGFPRLVGGRPLAFELYDAQCRPIQRLPQHALELSGNRFAAHSLAFGQRVGRGRWLRRHRRQAAAALHGLRPVALAQRVNCLGETARPARSGIEQGRQIGILIRCCWPPARIEERAGRFRHHVIRARRRPPHCRAYLLQSA